MHDQQPPTGIGWLEETGLPHLARILGIALHPAKLGIALAALIATFALGICLNFVSTLGGGVEDSAMPTAAVVDQLGRHYDGPVSGQGVFSAWWSIQQTADSDSMNPSGWCVAHAMPSTIWLAHSHPVYFALFCLGSLVIWAWGGGAICRIAALQFARNEKVSAREALRFAGTHLLGGTLLAPLLPLVFVVLIGLLLVASGVFLRIPVLGDLIGGIAFGLCLIGGLVITLLFLGLAVGGHLFWPAVVTEGQDAFDAFSRSLSYAFTRPWKTILYGFIAVVYGHICWYFAKFFLIFSLNITHRVVAFGTSPFGWWSRGTEEAPLAKLDLLWPFTGSGGLQFWPDWSRLVWYEYFSASFISAYVLVMFGLLLAFGCSFYFSGSTVIYFLLRRDVDKTDVGDVYTGEDVPEEDEAATGVDT